MGTDISRRLNVLVLTSSYPTPEEPVGGVFVREYARAASADATVGVVHLDGTADTGLQIESASDNGMLVRRVRYRGGPVKQLLAARAGWRSLPFTPDVVHAHFFVAGVPAVVLGRVHRVPVVISEHWGDFLPESEKPIRLSIRAAARFALGGADLVLPVSEALQDALRARGVRTPMRVLRNVVDTDVFSPGGAPEPGRLLAAGLFYREKGFERLLRALPRVVDEHPDVRLDLVGDGDLRPELERLAEGLPVTFHGRLSKPQLAALMRCAQLVVVPSDMESSGVVALEALASGVPVVARPVGALPEAIEDGAGLLVGDDDLAATLLVALDTRFDRAAIAAAARERYGADTIRRQLREVYCDLVK